MVTMHPFWRGLGAVVVVAVVVEVAVLLLVGVGVGVASKSYQPLAEIKVAKQENKTRLRIGGGMNIFGRALICS